MELSRHAKNKLREMPVTQGDLERVVSNPEATDRDKQGKPRYLGSVRGVQVCVVVAIDDPNLIVTVFRKERW